MLQNALVCNEKIIIFWGGGIAPPRDTLITWYTPQTLLPRRSTPLLFHKSNTALTDTHSISRAPPPKAGVPASFRLATLVNRITIYTTASTPSLLRQRFVVPNPHGA